jgi:hypothetical protein
VDDGDLRAELLGDVLELDKGGDRVATDFRCGVLWQRRTGGREGGKLEHAVGGACAHGGHWRGRAQGRPRETLGSGEGCRLASKRDRGKERRR